MIYIVFKGRIKAGMTEAFYDKVASASQKMTREQNNAAVYQFFKSQDDPHDFYLNEQWPSVADLHAHFDTLIAHYGPAKPHERLPFALGEYLEEANVTYYDAIA